MKKFVCALFGAAICVLLAVPVSARAASPSATEIIKEMGIGWNLGNSLESFADWTSGLALETSWNNPKTTKEMIDMVAEMGFSSVRIPVSWGQHTSGPDYKIDPEWMARVKTIADYCIDNNLYVVINIHHDDQNGYFFPSSDRFEASNKFITCVWQQIATEFADYDYHLIFEVFNEPKLVGSANEWWFDVNNPSEDVADAVECINRINQSALDTIRATGGNNSTRLVMCPGYDASIDGAIVSGYRLPEDKAGMVGVSIHAYTPYNFAMNVNTSEGAGSKFNSSFRGELDWFFDTLESKFVSKNIPVYIGEFGATDKANTADRVKWAEYYTGRCAELGIACLVWDNNVPEKGADKGERFGLLNRSTLEVYDAAYANALLKIMGTKGEYFEGVEIPEDTEESGETDEGTGVSNSRTEVPDLPWVTENNGETTESGASGDEVTEVKDKASDEGNSDDSVSVAAQNGEGASFVSAAILIISGTLLCVLGIVLLVVLIVKSRKKKETS
ncbi:MAG: glycoside hydrolase family 5 protein [Acetatifactor sp.]